MIRIRTTPRKILNIYWGDQRSDTVLRNYWGVNLPRQENVQIRIRQERGTIREGGRVRNLAREIVAQKEKKTGRELKEDGREGGSGFLKKRGGGG